ncbi:hypothetical protein SmJEL517_g00637 [Synchytrium microbalum]|uniref:S1 motif domain-containing protein n=1 Tax=Synchytrium microbalum TaxID=1806994 RepID=A0A507CE32_9FUNG|nr:uncharacterized protein SmJEL517_g00637 [Synchytrium microbalum]TPX37608.1 hypothetical protein SmJEL517_g00637 [Synchytrium microbalum]
MPPRKRKIEEEAPTSVSTTPTAASSTSPTKSYKKKKAVPPVPAQAPLPIAQSVVEDFPRGGALPLSALEFREVADRASKDVLFDQSASANSANTNSKKRSKQQLVDDARAAKKAKSAVPSEDKPKSTDVLTFKRLNVNMCLLGVIREINDLDLVLSLPDQLTGFVSITEISKVVTAAVESAAAVGDDEENDADLIPKLSTMFVVGQLMPCCIVALETTEPSKEHPKGRRRIELSLMPERVNARVSPSDIREGMTLSATVTSQEDHGYALSFGIEGVTGFLNNKHLGGHDALKAGDLVYSSVLTTNEARRVASVTLEASIVPSSQIKMAETMLLESLVPGLLVSAKVRNVTMNGLVLSFFGIFEGTVDMFHTGKRLVSLEDDLHKFFKVDQKVRARILFVDYERKRVGLTLRPTLVSWTRPESPASLDIGTIVEEMTVTRVDQDVGILLDCPGVEGAYCHLSRLSDTFVEKIDKKFRAKTQHRARVIGMDFCDGLIQVSLQPTVLAQTFYRHEDLKPGMIVKGRVLKLESYGMIVGLTDTIRGLCPRSHLSDVALSHPELKFKIDGAVKCRVLTVNPKAKKLTLTHKKSLLNSTLPIIESYNVLPGTLADGVITAVKDFGCIVSFYNDVKALAPISELSDAFSNRAADHFTMGQVVRCRVLTVNQQEEKMRVTLKPSAILRPDRPMDVNLVSIVSGTVLSVESSEAIIELSPSSLHGILTKSHITDFESNETPLFAILKSGMQMPELVVLSVDASRGRVYVTRKPLLIHAARQAASAGSLSSVENVNSGNLLPGFVKSLQSNACYIHFLGGLYGVARIHNLSDQYVSDISQHVRVGKSLLTLVTDVDTANNRLTVSTKSSQIQSHAQIKEYELVYLRSLFEEMDVLAMRSFEACDNLPSIRIGGLVKGYIKQKLPFGYTVDLADGVSGVLTFENADKRVLKVGEEVTGTVLDFDPAKNIADMTLTGLAEEDESDMLIQAFEKQRLLEAKIEMVKENYLIVTVMKHVIGFVATKTHSATMTSIFDKHRVGQTLKVSIGQVGNLESTQFASRRLLLVAPPQKQQENPTTTKSSKGQLGDRILKEPIDATKTSLDDFSVGVRVAGKIKAIKDAQMNVTLGANLFGRIHITELADEIAQLDDPKRPFKKYHLGQIVQTRVVGYHDAKTHRFLPVTHRVNGIKTVIELSLRPSLVDNVSEKVDVDVMPTSDSIPVGSVVTGFVKTVSDGGVYVLISPSIMGRIAPLELSDNVSVIEKPALHFSVGMAVKCRVLRKDIGKNSLDLSIRAVESPLDVATMKPGQVVTGRIGQISPATGYQIQLGQNIVGRVYLTDIADTYSRKTLKAYKVGQIVRCCVIDIDAAQRRLDLSLRPSRLAVVPEQDEDYNVEVQSIDDIKQDTVVSGFIKNISENGCFVAISHKLVARVKISGLSDAFVKDWKALYSIGQLVKGRILSVNSATGQIEMTLKASIVDGTAPAKALSLSDLVKGQKLRGTVKAIKPYGIFVSLGDGRLSGLCHISQVSDTPIKEVGTLYSVGDAVKVIVLEVDEPKKRLSLGLKPSYFDADDMSEVDDDDETLVEQVYESDDEEEQPAIDDDEEVDEAQEDGDSDAEMDDGEEDSEVDDDAKEEEEDSAPSNKSNPLAAQLSNIGELEIDTSFSWLMPTNEYGRQGANQSKPIVSADANSDDEDEDILSSSSKKASKKKTRDLKEREEAISKQEKLLMDVDRQPESVDDYERLLLGTPNASVLWIQYMAFVLQLAEIEKARQIAERALKVINFREEQEKMNVWVAYLNLENKFGSQESLVRVFDRAATVNDPKTMYLQMVRIYERSDKNDLTEELYTTILKRFKESSKCWTSAGLFYLKNGRAEDARRLLQRSLLSLPKHKHIKTISKFAQMEFKHGEPERGRTIFEGIVTNYPKRVDLWSVFLDMEIRVGDVAIIRRLFERVIQLKVSSKKIKYFYKRYLQFEKTHGTASDVEHVKASAKAYVDRISEK